MPINGVNIGQDVTLNFYDSIQGTPKFAVITEFKVQQEMKEVKSRPLGGPPKPLNLSDGWKGSFHVDRGSSVVDDYFASQEATYFSGGDIGTLYITETIINPLDRSVNQYRYDGVVLALKNAGECKQDDIVKMEIEFRASTRKKSQ